MIVYIEKVYRNIVHLTVCGYIQNQYPQNCLYSENIETVYQLVLNQKKFDKIFASPQNLVNYGKIFFHQKYPLQGSKFIAQELLFSGASRNDIQKQNKETKSVSKYLAFGLRNHEKTSFRLFMDLVQFQRFFSDFLDQEHDILKTNLVTFFTES